MFNPGDIVRSDYINGYLLVEVKECHPKCFSGTVTYVSPDAPQGVHRVGSTSAGWTRELFYLDYSFEENFNQSLNNLESCLKKEI